MKKKEGHEGVLLKHPSGGRVGCHRPHRSDRRPSMSRVIKSGGQKSARVSYTHRSENLAYFQRVGAWERVGHCPATSFFLQHRQPLTTLLSYLSSLSKACNSAF